MAHFFISHSSAQKDFCEKIHGLLMGKGHTCFLDKFDITGGSSIPQKISDGIHAADFFVLVISPEALASEWVRWELMIALYKEVAVLKNKVFVVPANRIACEHIPMIAYKNHLDFTGSPEDAVAALLALVSAPLSAAASQLKDGSHVVKMVASPDGLSNNKSTRVLEQSFNKNAFENGTKQLCAFPGAYPGIGLSIHSDKIQILTDESGQHLDRTTVTEIDVHGRIIVSETNFFNLGPVPWINAALFIQKVAKFIDFSNNLCADLNQQNRLNLTFEILIAIDRLKLGHDPSAIESGVFSKSEFDVPTSKLSASAALTLRPGQIPIQELAGMVYDIQADFFHPLRLSLNPMQPLQKVSFCYKKNSVQTYIEDCRKAEWYFQ